jgi:energy-coupling factor transporter ATP-binding protein EcfA2
MSANFQKLFRSGDDCHEDWKRIRPIATLMSSDNKKLIDKDKNQKLTPNSIGYRYSWIKMSSPSIESLRQAFLDHQSRILLPTDISSDTNPAHRSKHATIKSISIKNVAFLDNQEIHFSSNLNCVIGGRGSGKSTLLEYLRIVFGKEKLKDIDSGTNERIQRVRGTLNDPLAEVKVCWVSANGVEDRIAWQNNKPTVQGREMADPVTFFNSLPLHFYSQQQLNRLTDSEPDAGSVRQAQRLLELVDGFMKSQLDVLAEQEQKLKQKIKDAFSDLHRVNALENDYKRLQQECQELDRQWRARSEIQEDARKHQLLKAEARYFEVLAGAPGQQVGDITVLAETIAASHIPFQAKGSTHAVWIQNFDRKVKTAKDLLAQKIRETVNQYESVIDELKVADQAWHVIQAELDLADANFEDACAAKGLTTDDVGRLQEINQARSIKQRELGENGTEIQRLRKAVGDINNLMGQLHLIWREQFQKRVLATERANEGSVLNEGGQKFIKVTAKYQSDLKSFDNLWTSFCPPDKRTTLARQWVELGEKLFSNFILQSHHASPWELLEHYIATHDPFVLGSQTRQEYTLAEYINDNPADWERLRCSRIKDTVDMQLFRSDGSVAGSIAEGTLSDGQRNTAALALLLAQDGGPLVIDQPEDELDSNFVFRELIPMLRKVKSNRQIIMATHNANLPVNGDAELVYAFEAQNGKGRTIACGGLDQPIVTKAVLDIMEGTEEAFRRRREKYHF